MLPWSVGKTKYAHEIEAKLISELSRLPGRSAEISVHGPVSKSARSTVYYAEGAAYPTPAVVKVCTDTITREPAGEVATASFMALERLFKITSADSRLASSAPYDLFPHLGTLVGEWIPGPTVEASLKHSSRPIAQNTIKNAGMWLGQFNQTTGYTRRTLNAQKMLLDVGVYCKEHPGLQVKGLDRAINALRDTQHIVRSESVIWSRAFGDFKPSNLLISSERIHGIDSQVGDDATPAVIDAAHFLNHAALLLCRGYRPSDMERLLWLDEAFRTGYEANKQLELPSLSLAWTRLVGAVRLALRFRTWSRPPRAWVTGWMLSHFIAHLQQRLENLSMGHSREYLRHERARMEYVSGER